MARCYSRRSSPFPRFPWPLAARALLDDIATILDDVALMTKVAAKKSAAMADDVSVMTKVAAQKTAGVLGDDLALNAQQVTGCAPSERFRSSGQWPRVR